MRGRKSPGRIEAAGGDVDEINGVEMLVGQRRSTGAAEFSPHLRRRFVFHRSTAHEAELGLGECHPRNHRRRRGTPAGLAMANHAVGRIRSRGIAHGAAHAAALYVLTQPVFSHAYDLIFNYLMTDAAASAAFSFVGVSPKKKEPRIRGAQGAETGVLFRSHGRDTQ